VDDDPIIVEPWSRPEEDEHDYEIISASDGFEAGIQVNHFKPHLLILDIMMPDLNGFEVCKRIKSDESTKTTKIIVLSAYLDEENFNKMKENGADLCFQLQATSQLKQEVSRSCCGWCRGEGQADLGGLTTPA
jgi:CheY-like chemotaxis protein